MNTYKRTANPMSYVQPTGCTNISLRMHNRGILNDPYRYSHETWSRELKRRTLSINVYVLYRCDTCMYMYKLQIAHQVLYTLISWICWSSPPMSAYVSSGAFSSFITDTIGSVSSINTPTTAWNCGMYMYLMKVRMRWWWRRQSFTSYIHVKHTRTNWTFACKKVGIDHVILVKGRQKFEVYK